MELNDAVDQYIQRATTIFKGRASNFAQAGGYVWVRLGNESVRARAGSTINSTEVSVIKAGGEFYAFCATAPRVTRSTMDRFVKTRINEVSAEPNIKYVLRKTVAGVTSLYVCGWRSRCVKVCDLPTGFSLASDVCLNNLGGNNFLLSFVIGLGVTKNFYLYSQSGLINQYSDTSNLMDFAFRNLNGSWPTPFTAGYDFWWNALAQISVPVGFGKFVWNYVADSSTVATPIPSGGGTGGANYYRLTVDLSKTPIEVQKFAHPGLVAARSLSPTVETLSWSGLQVNSTWNKLNSSFLQQLSNTTDVSGSADLRAVWKISQSGNTGLGVRELYTAVYTGGMYAFVATPSDDFNTLGYGTGEATNTYAIGITRATNVRNYDVSDIGLTYVDGAPPPSQSIYQIQRKTSPQQVTVRNLGFDFTVKSSTLVTVYPPDINQGETSNFGTVIAASYHDGVS